MSDGGKEIGRGLEQPTNAGSQAAASEATPLFRLSGVTKRFGGVVAVHDVDFELRPGEVHALVGENGAGTSTLLTIRAGVLSVNPGEILIDGKPVSIGSVQAALDLGIELFLQDLNLADNLDFGANFFLGWSYMDARQKYRHLVQKTANKFRRVASAA